jgi:hypothetical protein
MTPLQYVTHVLAQAFGWVFIFTVIGFACIAGGA